MSIKLKTPGVCFGSHRGSAALNPPLKGGRGDVEATHRPIPLATSLFSLLLLSAILAACGRSTPPESVVEEAAQAPASAPTVESLPEEAVAAPSPEAPEVLPPPSTVPDIPVVLISLDTLRADHLSAYGYERKTTPKLDAWVAKEGVLFENAVSPETWTLPAHMSMFTGLHPLKHAVSQDRNLGPEIATLPEVLKEQGYATSGFNGHTWWLHPDRGFGRGFDVYANAPEVFRPARETRVLLDAWLDEHTGPRQFLFFHSYDMHYKIKRQGYTLPYDPGDDNYRVFSRPYLAEDPFASLGGLIASDILKAHREGALELSGKQHETIVALYDDCLRMLDEVVTDIFMRLRKMGIYSQALIIVTSDHGEGLDDRGYYDHKDVWEEECHIPLMVKFPNGAFAGQRFTGQVQLMDILPTVLDVLGMPDRPGLDGQSLLRLLKGEASPPVHTYIRNGGSYLAVRGDAWKLRWARNQQPVEYGLFNLNEDKGEQNSRYETDPFIASPMRRALHQFFQLGVSGWHLEVAVPSGAKWTGRITIQGDTAPAAASLIDYWGNITPLPPDAAGHLAAELGKSPPERMVLIPAEAASQFTLKIESEAPFTAVTGGNLQRDLRHFDATLDPAEPAFNMPEKMTPAEDQPILTLWYTAPPTAESATPVLSDEDRERLDALGYVDG